MQVLKIFTPFLICCIFWGINVECGKNGGIKAAGKHHQGEVQAKPAANMAIVKTGETLKAKGKGMKKTAAAAGGQVQKQKKHADKKAKTTHELVGNGKEAIKKNKSKESMAACMQKCMCEKWETNKNNNHFNGQKEGKQIRAKRANEYCKDCDKKVGPKDEDGDRWCAECRGYCGADHVYSAESTDVNCYYCDGNDIIKRNGEYYCSNCHEYRDSDHVYEWQERSESPAESDNDSDSSNDPCNSANSYNYQQFYCDQCTTEEGCDHLSSLIVGNDKCDWVDNQGCTKFVKYGLDGNELADSDSD